MGSAQRGAHGSRRELGYDHSAAAGQARERGGTPQVSVPIVHAIESALVNNVRVLGIAGRNGGYTKKYGHCVVVVPTVEPERLTPHTEGWQSVILHLLVSHPKLQRSKTKW